VYLGHPAQPDHLVNEAKKEIRATKEKVKLEIQGQWDPRVCKVIKELREKSVRLEE
jgi:hypothetical protein